MPGRDPVPALTDIFSLLLSAVPRGFFVVEVDERVVGYIVAPDRLSRIWWQAFVRGAILTWAAKFVLGMYNLPLHRLPRIIWNKLLFVGSEKSYSPPGPYGRILSVAVAPEARGQGLSKELVARALAWLRTAEVQYVKLEVRPDNLPAVKTYRGLGFVERGLTRDIQGSWLVLILKL
jgi:ribosomal protein S18 acetylase RimI-like enzyme